MGRKINFVDTQNFGPHNPQLVRASPWPT